MFDATTTCGIWPCKIISVLECSTIFLAFHFLCNFQFLFPLQIFVVIIFVLAHVFYSFHVAIPFPLSFYSYFFQFPCALLFQLSLFFNGFGVLLFVTPFPFPLNSFIFYPALPSYSLILTFRFCLSLTSFNILYCFPHSFGAYVLHFALISVTPPTHKQTHRHKSHIKWEYRYRGYIVSLWPQCSWFLAQIAQRRPMGCRASFESRGSRFKVSFPKADKHTHTSHIKLVFRYHVANC